jgi:hypothetical protein
LAKKDATGCMFDIITEINGLCKKGKSTYIKLLSTSSVLSPHKSTVAKEWLLLQVQEIETPLQDSFQTHQLFNGQGSGQ